MGFDLKGTLVKSAQCSMLQNDNKYNIHEQCSKYIIGVDKIAPCSRKGKHHINKTVKLLKNHVVKSCHDGFND